MGWLKDDAPGHEGYLVAVRALAHNRFQERFQEIGTADDILDVAMTGPLSIELVQVGCDCGWRSRRFWAPYRTEWQPSAVNLYGEPGRACEEAARLMFFEHVAAEAARPDGENHLIRLPYLPPADKEPTP